MPYDKKFFESYRRYLAEESVRQSHDLVFRNFARFVKEHQNNSEMLWVVDLGCGLCEYDVYDRCHWGYVGIDREPRTRATNVLKADYTAFEFMDRLPFEANAFTSLFSIECCYPPARRYELYHQIFKKIPSIRFGLSGGFYYESRRHQQTVREAGGNISHQTIENPTQWVSRYFSEERFKIHTPSKMFGPDVVEIWKFFARK